jgi:hypothetical protein
VSWASCSSADSDGVSRVTLGYRAEFRLSHMLYAFVNNQEVTLLCHCIGWWKKLADVGKLWVFLVVVVAGVNHVECLFYSFLVAFV